MHAQSGLRVLLEWKIYRPDSVIAAVIWLKDHWTTINMNSSNPDAEIWDTLRHICLRPRMYLGSETDQCTFRDVLMFVWGVAIGASPPHGCLRMNEFVQNKFGNTAQNQIWLYAVEEEFADLDLADACAQLGKLIDEFRENSND